MFKTAKSKLCCRLKMLKYSMFKYIIIIMFFLRYQIVPEGFCQRLLFCYDKSLLWAGGLIWTLPTGYSGDQFLHFSKSYRASSEVMLWLLHCPWYGSHISRVKRKIIFQLTIYDCTRVSPLLDIQLLNYDEFLALFSARHYSRQSISIYIA